MVFVHYTHFALTVGENGSSLESILLKVPKNGTSEICIQQETCKVCYCLRVNAVIMSALKQTAKFRDRLQIWLLIFRKFKRITLFPLKLYSLSTCSFLMISGEVEVDRLT